MSKTQNHNKNLNELASKLIEIQKEAVEKTLAYCKPIVQDIISTEIKDEKEIEHTLDALLEVAFDDEVLIEYKKLCRYYYNINPQATADYVQFYREMWDEDYIENNDEN